VPICGNSCRAKPHGSVSKIFFDTPGPDPRPVARLVDRHALRVARLTSDACAACGRTAGSVHHVIPRSEGGDDVAGNLLLLCGSGTTGCHGALHGSPYVITRQVVQDYIRVLGEVEERRDADWVAERLGLHIVNWRPDILTYVYGKLGREAGAAYLVRRYLLD